MYRIGNEHYHAKRFEEAVQFYEEAIKLDPVRPIFWNNKGAAHFNLGKYHEAIECHDKALQLDENNIEAWNNKGTSLNALGKYREAIECYDKALQLDENYISAWYNKGNAHFNLGKYHEALISIDMAIKLKPDYSKAIELRKGIKKAIAKNGKLNVDRIKEVSNSSKSGIIVFISYATKDSDLFRVRLIDQKLTQYEKIQDVIYWEEDLEDNIFEFMNKYIGVSDIMLLLCSPNSLNSDPVKKEWTAMEAISKPIIPLFKEVDHIPSLLRSRLGVRFNEEDIDATVKEIYENILRKNL